MVKNPDKYYLSWTLKTDQKLSNIATRMKFQNESQNYKMWKHIALFCRSSVAQNATDFLKKTADFLEMEQISWGFYFQTKDV